MDICKIVKNLLKSRPSLHVHAMAPRPPHDAGGMVFYANCLKFFERARTEWLRELGFSQELMRLQDGVMLLVGSTQVRDLNPARLDDLPQVSVEVRDLGRAACNCFSKLFAASACWPQVKSASAASVVWTATAAAQPPPLRTAI